MMVKFSQFLLLASLLLLFGSFIVESASLFASRAGSKQCRLIAIGDLHGDLQQTIKVLHEIAKVTDNTGLSWTGGCATLVQTGDIMDRGDESLAVLDLFARLRVSASKRGGQIVMLLANHELMNLAQDFRYVAEAEMDAKGGVDAFRNLFSKGGMYGSMLRRRRKIVHFDAESGTVFVHGGLTPEFVEEQLRDLQRQSRQDKVVGGGAEGQVLVGGDDDQQQQEQQHEKNRNRNGKQPAVDGKTLAFFINRKGAQKLLRNVFTDAPSETFFGNDGPLWDRSIVSSATMGECSRLEKALELFGATRMIVGHTPQQNRRIGSFCGSRLVDIDVGLSKAMLKGMAALEIDRATGDAFALYPGDKKVKLQ